MAFPAADAPTSPAPGALARWWARLVAAVEAYPVERIGLAAVAAGVVLRLAAPFFMDFRSDGDTYVAMGHAWMLHHAFLMPYGDVTTWGPTGPQYSNHYPPAYPFYLGLVFSAFGFGLWQAKMAAVAMALAALLVAYVCTRDLYGADVAALVTGLLALEPHLVWVAGTGFSENMVLLFFTLTMWAIVRSLRDDRYIVLAGLFAGLAYLSKSSVGYFFVIAGGGGFLWRFWYRRWKLFTNFWYMMAIGVFLAIALWWAARNVALFGSTQQTLHVLGRTLIAQVPNWETSSYVRYVQGYALDHPDLWRTALLAKIPFFAVFLLWYALPFLPESWAATKKIRDEETSALWLSVFLVWVTGWVIASMFWTFEKSSLYWFDNHRYTVIGLLPLGWLLLREADLARFSTRLRYVLLALSLFAACGAVLLSPAKFSDLHAAEALDPYLRPGDEVGLGGGTIKYAFYAYLTHPEQIQVYGCQQPAPTPPGCEPGRHPAFILTLNDDTYGPDYQQVGVFRQTYWNGGIMTAKLWARTDVIDARHVPTDMVDNGV
jgi:Dolichyl-phosphate-mannose-protein mannosyltransferase